MSTCTIDDCENSVDAKGLCSSHYHRLCRYGDPLAGGSYRPRGTLEERFWPKVDASGDCWIWTGATNNHGYGMINQGGRDGPLLYAHRTAWQLLVGPIPEDLTIDHLCRNPPCVNPDHLEPVTHLENIRRGIWAKKTHCPQGHVLQGENLYIRPGNGLRMCKRCSTERNLARNARDRAATQERLNR